MSTENIDMHDPEWTEGRPWYTDAEIEARDNAVRAHSTRGDSIREAAAMRKAFYLNMAKEVMDEARETREGGADSGQLETREANAEPVEPVEVPRLQVREPDPNARSIEVNAPVEEHMAFTRAPKAEYDKPMPKGASFADLLEVPASQRGLSLGKHLRGVLTGDWRGAEMEQRAMSGVTAGAGGALLPVVYSAQVIDLARVQCQVLNAGAQLVPMSARQVIMPKWTADPTVAFRNENAAVGTSDATVDKITFTAQSLAGYTTLSREIIEDTDLSDLLANAYAKSVAIAWDNAALFGTGSAPQPLGLKNNTAVTDKSAVIVNGQTPTWDNMIDMVGGVFGRNESVGAIIYHPRNELALGKVKDSQQRYLDVPRYLANIPRLATGTVPVNEVEGTSGAVCNTAFAGDFSQLFIGMRTSFGVNVYDAPAATTGQVLMVAWMRMDVQVGRGSAFAIRTGLKA